MLAIGDDVVSELERMGEWRDLARQTLAQISRDMPALVREAQAQGLTKAQIMRLARVSRPALDEMLRRP